MSSNPNATTARQDDLASMKTEVGQIARGAGLGLGGNVLYYFLNFLFTVLVARLVGAEAFGLYTLGVTTVTLLSRFSVMGLDRGAIRYVSIKRRAGDGGAIRQVILTSILIGLGVSITVALLLAFFPEFFLQLFRWRDKTYLLTLFPVFALALPAMVMVSIGVAGTQAFRTMRYRALIPNTLIPLTKLLGAVALFFVLGVTALTPTIAFAVAQIVGGVLALYFLFRLARRYTHPMQGNTAWEPGLTRELLVYSFPLLLSSVLVYLNGRTEIMVLGIYHQADASGIYNAAMRFATLPLMVLTAFNAIFMPVIADLHHRGEMQRLDALFKLVTRWVIMVAMPILLALFLYAEAFIGFFGRDFATGVIVLRILSLSTLINFSTGSVGVMLLMTGYSNLALFNAFLTLLVALALDFLLIPTFGITGAAVAGMLSLIVVNLVNLGEVRYLLRIQPYNRRTLRPFIAAIPAAIGGWLLTRWVPVTGLLSLAWASALVAGVYFGGLMVLGWDDEDRMMFAALSKRFRRLLGR